MNNALEIIEYECQRDLDREKSAFINTLNKGYDPRNHIGIDVQRAQIRIAPQKSYGGTA